MQKSRFAAPSPNIWLALILKNFWNVTRWPNAEFQLSVNLGILWRNMNARNASKLSRYSFSSPKFKTVGYQSTKLFQRIMTKTKYWGWRLQKQAQEQMQNLFKGSCLNLGRFKIDGEDGVNCTSERSRLYLKTFRYFPWSFLHWLIANILKLRRSFWEKGEIPPEDKKSEPETETKPTINTPTIKEEIIKKNKPDTTNSSSSTNHQRRASRDGSASES